MGKRYIAELEIEATELAVEHIMMSNGIDVDTATLIFSEFDKIISLRNEAIDIFNLHIDRGLNK